MIDNYTVPGLLANSIDTSEKYQRPSYEPRKVAPDTIKDPAHIKLIKDWFLANGRFRDNLLFTMGIGCGLRASDLVKLRFGDLMEMKDGKLRYKEFFYTMEQKTTKRRKIYVTLEMIEACNKYIFYIRGKRDISLNSFLFVSESSNKKRDKPCKGAYNAATGTYRVREKDYGMCVDTVSDKLNEAVSALGLPYHVASHTLRKTFAYHFLLNFRDEFGLNDTQRALITLQKVLNHASVSDTLRYIGISEDEIKSTCMEMYPAQKNKYLKSSVM